MPQDEYGCRRKILRYLANHEGEWFSQRELHHELHFPLRMLSPALRELCDGREIRAGTFFEPHGPKGRGATVRYRVANARERARESTPVTL